ncbi:MAG: hypothetical protein Q4G20_01590 [Paracoccus sp. (in: a-proteobacteria)]|nr:hypothetical protein [Paracoccus sp. (in: a-proteobacteria)]
MKVRRPYAGSGLCFRPGSTRARMQAFYDELRREYVAFRDTWQVQETNETDWGPSYKPPPF